MNTTLINKINNCTIISDSRSKFTVSEKGKAFELDNANGLKGEVIKVDQCIYLKSDITTERCDYLMHFKDKNKLYFIELKGSDIAKAINQIITSFNVFKNHYLNYEYQARIVCGQGIPEFRQNKNYIKLKSLLKSTPIIKNTKKHSEPI